MAGRGSGGNVIAALCNIFIPGLGQLVQGRLMAAVGFFVTVSVCYFFWALIIPALIGGLLHLWCILDAAKFRG